MKFSVIIPAWNEAQHIKKAIKALEKQNIPRNNFEIIVVDNNSTDNTFNLAKSAGADKVVRELKQGTNLARQQGYQISQGKIIVFLDADSVPPPNWLSLIEKKFKNSNIVAVSGPFDYGFTNIHHYLEQIYVRQILPRIPKILKIIFRRSAGIIIGGNFATRRNVIEAIGGLPKLDFWGDDAATAMLISRKVGKVVFDPNFVVKSSPRRFYKQGFFCLAFQYGLSYFKTYFSKNYQ